ncbi:hypothetical protein [Pseudomonas reactans]|uniref:hypothetical protein n=1 Tax=Pseudomonas reactans TaxID=117680 RepID=UPI0015A11F2F|nr:hypothetical protein [Pseudomonas reactans]NWC90015.1 hypothetical protein [Pseudomonas reactans]
MRERYLLALVSAALASVKYRSFRRIYEEALFIGPLVELPDGTLVRMGNERWSNSTEDARTALAKTLQDEGYSWFIYGYPRVSSENAPVVAGESVSDVNSRVAYTHARDGLVEALRRLAEISLEEGRDPRTSALYASFECSRELLNLLEPSLYDETTDFEAEAMVATYDPIAIIRSLYLAGSRKNNAQS